MSVHGSCMYGIGTVLGASMLSPFVPSLVETCRAKL